MCAAVVQMFNRLSNVPNRIILYDLYNYICDIKSGVTMAKAYVKTLGETRSSSLIIIITITTTDVCLCCRRSDASPRSRSDR